MSDSREQFEAWVCKRWPSAAQEVRYKRDALPTDHPRHGHYVNNDLQVAWEGWQASRQALEIDLPDDGIQDCERDWGDRCKDTFDCGYNYACEQHEKAIEAAGVRVKQCS